MTQAMRAKAVNMGVTGALLRASSDDLDGVNYGDKDCDLDEDKGSDGEASSDEDYAEWLQKQDQREEA